MRTTIGLDVGGTKIFGIVMSPSGKILRSVKTKTKPGKVLQEIFAMIEELGLTGVRGIGIGVPSIVNQGMVVKTANIKGFSRIPLAKIAQRRFKVPVFIQNDCRCFVLGEHRFGAGKNHRDIVGITLGTGIGSGIIANSRLVIGGSNAAGEVGHMKVVLSGRRCGCGREGCFEAYCSGKGIERTYKDLTGKDLDLYSIISQRDAKKTMDLTYEYLALGLSNIATILDPELIIIGGGVANKLDFPRIRVDFKKNLFYSKAKIAKSSAGPAVGAASLPLIL